MSLLVNQVETTTNSATLSRIMDDPCNGDQYAQYSLCERCYSPLIKWSVLEYWMIVRYIETMEMDVAGAG